MIAAWWPPPTSDDNSATRSPTRNDERYMRIGARMLHRESLAPIYRSRASSESGSGGERPLAAGNLWPITYALTTLTDTEEIKIANS